MPGNGVDLSQTRQATEIYIDKDLMVTCAERGMYLDSVVLASLLTIATLLAILVYLTYYGYRHLRDEEEKVAISIEENSKKASPRG